VHACEDTLLRHEGDMVWREEGGERRGREGRGGKTHKQRIEIINVIKTGKLGS
jgi:hypothetical protein